MALKAFIIYFAVWLAAFSVQAGENICADLYPSVNFTMKISRDGGGVTINNVGQVTGNEWYPLTYIFANFRITPKVLEQWKSFPRPARWKSKVFFVLSLGEGVSEGVSELVPNLNRIGLASLGLDFWYNETLEFPDNTMGKQMAAYVKRNSENLVQADATHLPFANDSIPVILAHKLLNNLSSLDAIFVLQEIMRTLAVGGEARLSVSDFHPLHAFITTYFPEELVNFDAKNGVLFYRKTRPTRITTPYWAEKSE